jgi:hypothetical protein
VHGRLHSRLKILHTKTEAIKTELFQMLESNWIDCSGIDFNRKLRLGGEGEIAAQSDHQLVQIVVIQEGG